MVESMRQISNPARSKGVATAKIPKGAVASELANDGKKKTILRDLDNGFSSAKENDRYSSEPSCHRNVSSLSGVCCNRQPGPAIAFSALSRLSCPTARDSFFEFSASDVLPQLRL